MLQIGAISLILTYEKSEIYIF